MAEAVHEHGALAGIELTHAGGQASTQGSCWPSLAPSQIVSDYFTYQAPKAMKKADIFRVQED
jgi:2,4-dienoyl-CoA reductase-like NADH-dependent reductase (Old Yellow Enzyme family)